MKEILVDNKIYIMIYDIWQFKNMSHEDKIQSNYNDLDVLKKAIPLMEKKKLLVETNLEKKVRSKKPVNIIEKWSNWYALDQDFETSNFENNKFLRYDTLNWWEQSDLWNKKGLKWGSINDVYNYFKVNTDKDNRKQIADNLWIEDYDYSAEKNQDLIIRSVDVLKNNLKFLDKKDIKHWTVYTAED